MARKIADEEDGLRRRARRRLIGAVVLVTVVVVLLPMVLDNEPEPVSQNIDLTIPDKGKVGEFTPNIEPQPETSADIAPPPLPEATPPAPSAPAVAETPAPAPQAAAPKPATEKPAASAFVIQFGAFSNAGTANKLKQKLSQEGVEAYVEKIGNMNHVRAGPYATRAEAESVKAQASMLGVEANVRSAQ
ncbi:MAG: SPOR domain-containing protein [Gallionellaceae bacterium]|jgi:DedD protein|nr:SPOR domain-containing protein [Gallionellaceae bacterium]